MSLKSVRVPEALAPAFELAESVVSRYFDKCRQEPALGEIDISGERYVLVRAASLSVEFFGLVEGLYGSGREQEAASFARNILFDLAHAIGKADARSFHAKMGLVDPIARLSAGPIHFSHTGWALVEILPESVPAPDETFCLVFDHPYSFEASAWLAAGRTPRFPACIMSAGYSSGWCEESFGLELVSSELTCRALGDERCRFVMAPPRTIEARVRAQQSLAPVVPARGDPQIPDFFARKRAEEALRKSHEELEQRVEARTQELSRANRLLQAEMAERERVERELRQKQKLEAVGRLAGGIAHDFNNLMGVVLGRCAIMRSRIAADDPLRAELDEIRAAGEHAAALTQQLLAFGRAQVLRREVLDLDRTVDDIVQVLRPLIPEDVEIRRVPNRLAGNVEADRGRLEQVIMNLVINARDAMPSGGQLTIETSSVAAAVVGPVPDVPPGAYAAFTVADTGVGMEAETLAHVFEPFFTTKGEGEGAGLGLATVYGIVRQLGGGVAVTSEAGHGARFTVYLPRCDRPSQSPSAEPFEEALRGTETILLVEDRANLRRVLAQVLTDLGYDVQAAGAPEEALELAGTLAGPIHVLLTDVVMPRMGGAELARRVLERRPDIRVVYMSGHASEAVVGRGISDAGAVFLQKPFAPEQLAATIRRVLGQK